MALNIGRLGVIDTDLIDPESVELRAGRRGEMPTLRIKGTLIAPTLAETLRQRDEIVGLREGRLVPLTWDQDATLDGYYLVEGADADVVSLLDKGVVDYSIDLQRLGGAADTWFQSKLIGTVRTNDHGLAAAEVLPWLAIPAWGDWLIDQAGAVHTNAFVGNDVQVFYDVDLPARPLNWRVPPAYYYAGAATVKIDSLVTDRLWTPTAPATWELTNGLLRVQGTTINADFTIAAYVGAAWESVKTWQHGYGAAPTWLAGVASAQVQVIRNEPHVVTLRLLCIDGNLQVTDWLDLTLRRGAHWLEVTHHRTTADELAQQTTTAEAVTAVTPTGASAVAAYRATANDADGNQLLSGVAKTIGSSAAGGEIVTSATLADGWFFAGVIPAGSGAAAPVDADSLCLRAFAAHVEVVRAGRR